MNLCLKLHFSPKKKKYYFLDETECLNCFKKIQNIFFIHESYSRKKSSFFILCQDCIDKIHRKEVDCYKIVSIIEKDYLPEDAFPIFLKPPLLSVGRENVWSGAKIENTQIETRIIDRTKLAGRRNCTFDDSQMPKNEKILRIDELQDEKAHDESKRRVLELDREVKPGEIDCYLNKMKNSMPLIDKSDEIQLIEKKRNEFNIRNKHKE